MDHDLPARSAAVWNAGPVSDAYGGGRLKMGSDAVGIGLGLLTIPMALLSMGGVAAGLLLAVRQDWPALIFGVVAFLLCSAAAPLLERVVIFIDDAAARSAAHRGRARLFAIVSGALPVAVIFTAQVVSLRGVTASVPPTTPLVLAWLWGYGVATGPWSLFIERVSRFRRTVVSIRAYAGHVAMWLFTVAAMVVHASPVVVVLAMVIPAILPFTVGLLLALADRDAITNVRV